MTFFRKHREKLLSALAIVVATLIINGDRLFTDTRPLRWSKEYVVTGSRPDLEHTIEEIRRDAFEAMRGSWTGSVDSKVRLIKVELRGAK